MSVNDLAHKHSLNVATAVLAALAVWRLGLVPELPAVLAFIFGGVLLSAIDWKVHRLPTRVVYSTLAAVAVGLLFASIVKGEWFPLATAGLGAVLLANAFFLVYLIGRKVFGMMVLGFGDVRLGAVLGLLLGWYGLPYVFYGALVGNLLVVVIAIATCVRQRKLQLQYAFAAPLIAGALAVVLLHA